MTSWLLPLTKMSPPPNNCLVVLHNIFGVGAGGEIFFFFFKSKLNHMELSPNEGADKFTLPKIPFIQDLKCKQVDNKNLQNVFKRSKFAKKKTTFFWLNPEN